MKLKNIKKGDRVQVKSTGAVVKVFAVPISPKNIPYTVLAVDAKGYGGYYCHKDLRKYRE